MKNRFDTVLFDFWITLVEIDKIQVPIRRKYFSFFLAEKTNILPEKTIQAYEAADRIANNLREHHHKEIPGGHFVYLFAKALGLKNRFKSELEQLYCDSVLGLDLKLRDGAVETLKALRPNYKIGLISNTSIGIVVKALLSKFSIEKYFDVVVLSDETSIRKPEPYIFHYTLSKIGSYPEKTIFVGDNPYLDVLGAKGCGLYSVFIGDLAGFPENVPRPDLVIDDLRLLIDKL